MAGLILLRKRHTIQDLKALWTAVNKDHNRLRGLVLLLAQELPAQICLDPDIRIKISYIGVRISTVQTWCSFVYHAHHVAPHAMMTHQYGNMGTQEIGSSQLGRQSESGYLAHHTK
jgi:hypothetical protein